MKANEEKIATEAGAAKERDGLKRKNRWLILANGLLVVALVAVLPFAVYKRYDDVVTYAKPDLDLSQKKYEEPASLAQPTEEPDPTAPAAATEVDSEAAEQPENTEQPGEIKSGDGSFTLYSVGDTYSAASGDSQVAVDVRNQSDSTHDIVMRWFITREEMEAHGIDTRSMADEDVEWKIAETGLFEPGYSIASVQLRPLPDGSYLPAGSYTMTMSELYYDHKTGVLASYEARIPITLEVAN